jgi:hypothetical protein
MANEVSVKDVMGVRSRVSWGAILGGAMTTVAVFFLLSVLGTAIGATILYKQGDTDISTGAAIWAIITLILALFAGGCVVSQCTAGETKDEAVMYGVILWGTIFTMLLALMATRVNVGFVGVMGETLTPAAAANQAQAAVAGASANARPETTQEKVADLARDSRTVSAAWWTFGGILLSMLAAISGALTGSGPVFRLAGLGFRSAVVTQTTGTRTAV